MIYSYFLKKSEPLCHCSYYVANVFYIIIINIYFSYPNFPIIRYSWVVSVFLLDPSEVSLSCTICLNYASPDPYHFQLFKPVWENKLTWCGALFNYISIVSSLIRDHSTWNTSYSSSSLLSEFSLLFLFFWAAKTLFLAALHHTWLLVENNTRTSTPPHYQFLPWSSSSL